METELYLGDCLESEQKEYMMEGLIELWKTDKGYYWLVDDVVVGFKTSGYYKTIEEAYSAIGIAWEFESK